MTMRYLFTMKLNDNGVFTQNSLSVIYDFEVEVLTWLTERKFKFSYEKATLKWYNGPKGPEIIGNNPTIFCLSDLHEAIEFKLQWGDEFVASTGFNPNGAIYYKIISDDDKNDS